MTSPFWDRMSVKDMQTMIDAYEKILESCIIQCSVLDEERWRNDAEIEQLQKRNAELPKLRYVEETKAETIRSTIDEIRKRIEKENVEK